MAEEKLKNPLPRKVARIILKTVLFLVLFILLLFVLLLTPPVQKALTGTAENYLREKLGTRVEIGRISFGLSGKLALLDVYIEDKSKDTLIQGGAIKTHISILKLFSNEIQIKDIELQNINAKIRRTLPDTSFNFQFIVDAFTRDQAKNPDTAASAPMKLSISDLSMENVRFSYVDAVTGNDVWARVGNLTATFDTVDTYQAHFDIPSIIARNVDARIRQTKPLLKAEPLAKDLADAAKPAAMQLHLGTIDLSKVNIDFSNDVSAFYTTLNIGSLKAKAREIDLAQNKIHLQSVALSGSTSRIRLGKKVTEEIIEKELAQEVKAQATQGWDLKVDQLRIDNNNLRFDNDNQRALASGMDYGHLDATALTLHVDNLVFNKDAIGGRVVKGSVREKGGLNLQALQGEVLYGASQSYLKDLYIKTPGSEIRRNLVLDYASQDALVKNFEATVFNLELTDSRIQVKDILVFAPHLRSNPAFRRPGEVWTLDIVGSGTLNRMNFDRLRFNGLGNTRINAEGTLAGLMNPQNAGGNFVIHELQTTQTDLALFTGQRLSNSKINLPEQFNINGTINGNAGKLNTNLDIVSSAGTLRVDGSFSNLTDPNRTAYNARISTSGLKIGSILRMQDQLGNLSGNFVVSGTGITPNNMNTAIRGNISTIGYNRYQYRNIALDGRMRGSAFTMNINANDPNADLNLTANGRLSGKPSFTVSGMVDSLKTLPLNFTTKPLVFRGAINGRVNDLNPDYLDAELTATKVILVSEESRLAMDTVSFQSGRNDTGSFMHLYSDIVNADVTGQYRFSDLGKIVQSTIQPYFSVTPPAQQPAVKPYDFNFRADVVYHPILSVFIPALKTMDTLHAEGNFATGRGMNAKLNSSMVNFNGNEMSDLNLTATTTAEGLKVSGLAAHLKAGTLDLYNARVNATALNNVIDFNVGIDDASSRNRYFLSGLINQPSTGTYVINLRNDSLMLNYELWTVPQNNRLVISPNSITASDLVLSRGGQQLSISSLPGGTGNNPLQLQFTNFKLATITGFIRSDSTLADGLLNGRVTFTDLAKQPAFTSNLNITDLSFRQDTIGNVALQVNTGSGNRYNTNAVISGRGNDIVLDGFFTPSGKDLALDLDLDIRALQLGTMEGALRSAISNPSGAINGKISFRGTTAQPSIQGDLNFDKASFALNMLGSQFNIDNEKLSVSENGFAFDNFTIRDSANNALTIDGTILTSNFINYDFNLGVRARDFMVMNSTKEQNKLYYGRLNISSNMRISGTEVRPVVDGSVTVNEGTNLSIVVPQAEPGVREREGIVEFVDMDAPGNDTLFLALDSLNTTNIRGMDIAANIEVKKEAVLNVIIDQANGDFLNVQGEALISAGVDPSGKITMVGNYTLENGSYQISFNFLRRKFDIVKGSTITWTGEPTTAQLDVSAVYVANTSPIDLVQDQIAGSTPAIRNTYLQELPFEVNLSLTGELLKPVVDFDINLPEERNYGVSNDIVTVVQGRLSQIRQDEGEINKQVFSLLLLGRFVGENPFESSGGGFSAGTYARQSVSRLLTEQLNQLGANLIQGVDINFDLQSTEDYTTGERRNRTDLNVGLSKRLLNDRLKITVGSNFELEGPQNTNQRSNNIAGNIAADYQISRDGRYLIRFFRRNQYEGIVDGYIIENGISFILSVDYNRFREILRSKRQRVTRDSTNQNVQGR